MTDFKKREEALNSVIEFYCEAGYNEGLIAAIMELLKKYQTDDASYDELAANFDTSLQEQNIYFDCAQLYAVMMKALLRFSEYEKG